MTDNTALSASVTVETLPVVAGVEIPVDSEGRYNLNALHRASGEGKHKAPNKWLENQQAQAFVIAVKSQTPNLGSGKESNTYEVLKIINGGNAPGTFAHELIAVEYAGWISPSFRIKVNQTFIDYRTGKLQPSLNPANLSRLQLIEIAMQAEQERLALESTVAVIQPKADALDRIATASDGAMCMTDAAKMLQIRPLDLKRWLLINQWIYRRNGNNNMLGYANKLQQGVVEHKVHVQRDETGVEQVHERLLITPKGLAILATVFQVQLSLKLAGEAA
jgi:phage antirepressor YoqD-like protein